MPRRRQLAGGETCQLAAEARNGVKIAGMLALIAAGFVLAEGSAGQSGATGPAGACRIAPANLARAIMMISFTYGGCARVGYAAGEMKDSRRTMPTSLFAGIPAVNAVNLLMNVFCFRTPKMEGIARSTAA